MLTDQKKNPTQQPHCMHSPGAVQPKVSDCIIHSDKMHSSFHPCFSIDWILSGPSAQFCRSSGRWIVFSRHLQATCQRVSRRIPPTEIDSHYASMMHPVAFVSICAYGERPSIMALPSISIEKIVEYSRLSVGVVPWAREMSVGRYLSIGRSGCFRAQNYP